MVQTRRNFFAVWSFKAGIIDIQRISESSLNIERLKPMEIIKVCLLVLFSIQTKTGGFHIITPSSDNSKSSEQSVSGTLLTDDKDKIETTVNPNWASTFFSVTLHFWKWYFWRFESKNTHKAARYKKSLNRKFRSHNSDGGIKLKHVYLLDFSNILRIAMFRF